MVTINIRNTSSKKCAFCKHWYDVTNSAIKPKSPQIGVWQYDTNAKEMCLIKGIETRANNSCSKFECKLL